MEGNACAFRILKTFIPQSQFTFLMPSQAGSLLAAIMQVTNKAAMNTLRHIHRMPKLIQPCHWIGVVC
jgi:hypothetical protein